MTEYTEGPKNVSNRRALLVFAAILLVSGVVGGMDKGLEAELNEAVKDVPRHYFGVGQ